MTTLDLIENLLNGLYLLFTHNGLLIAYFSGLVVSGIISFYRPSRLSFLFTLSFLVLTFSFEYDKHIINPLREQTLATLVPNPLTHRKFSKLINLILSELLPVFFFILGWVLLLLSIFLSVWTKSNLVGKKEKAAPD